MANRDLAAELQALKNREGLLVPPDIHEWAKNHPGSLIYKHLVWDDAKAGYEYRLGQIRQLIAVHIRDDDGKRTTFSLTFDRKRPGGGIRDIADIVQAPDLREAMLVQAGDDARPWVQKYETLRDFAGDVSIGSVVDALNELIEEIEQHRQAERRQPAASSRKRRERREDRPSA